MPKKQSKQHNAGILPTGKLRGKLKSKNNTISSLRQSVRVAKTVKKEPSKDEVENDESEMNSIQQLIDAAKTINESKTKKSTKASKQTAIVLPSQKKETNAYTKNNGDSRKKDDVVDPSVLAALGANDLNEDGKKELKDIVNEYDPKLLHGLLSRLAKLEKYREKDKQEEPVNNPVLKDETKNKSFPSESVSSNSGSVFSNQKEKRNHQIQSQTQMPHMPFPVDPYMFGNPFMMPQMYYPYMFNYQPPIQPVGNTTGNQHTHIGNSNSPSSQNSYMGSNITNLNSYVENTNCTNSNNPYMANGMNQNNALNYGSGKTKTSTGDSIHTQSIKDKSELVMLPRSAPQSSSYQSVPTESSSSNIIVATSFAESNIKPKQTKKDFLTMISSTLPYAVPSIGVEDTINVTMADSIMTESKTSYENFDVYQKNGSPEQLVKVLFSEEERVEDDVDVVGESHSDDSNMSTEFLAPNEIKQDEKNKNKEDVSLSKYLPEGDSSQRGSFMSFVNNINDSTKDIAPFVSSANNSVLINDTSSKNLLTTIAGESPIGDPKKENLPKSDIISKTENKTETTADDRVMVIQIPETKPAVNQIPETKQVISISDDDDDNDHKSSQDVMEMKTYQNLTNVNETKQKVNPQFRKRKIAEFLSTLPAKHKVNVLQKMFQIREANSSTKEINAALQGLLSNCSNEKIVEKREEPVPHNTRDPNLELLATQEINSALKGLISSCTNDPGSNKRNYSPSAACNPTPPKLQRLESDSLSERSTPDYNFKDRNRSMQQRSAFFEPNTGSPESTRNLYLQDEDGDTLLHIAIAKENVNLSIDIIKKMKGFRLDSMNKLGQTPLHMALYVHNLDIIRALLHHGADTSIVDGHGNSVVHIACEENSVEIIDCLFEFSTTNRQKYVDMALKRNNYGLAALHLAMQKANLDIIDRLVRYGINLDVQEEKSGKTALIMAFQKCHWQLANLFIHAGADVNIPTYSGYYPLNYAVHANKLDLVKLLLLRNAEIGNKTAECEYGGKTSEEIKKLLDKEMRKRRRLKHKEAKKAENG